MNDYRLGAVEAHFAEIIWENEPISSGKLVELCAKELDWKKSTTYTVLRKLCEKGIFKNEGAQVCSLLSKDDFYSLQSERFVEENFEGSLPAFLAAFTSRKALSSQEIKEIQQMIDSYKGE